jgi:2-succinyl-6-hydroxy-2,4-cyclohexadiene-1-carboxylate synthase
MVAITSKKIVVGNDRIYHIDLAGDPTRPPIMLLHGFTGSRSSWTPFLPALATKYHVVIPDLPGHGESFVSPNIYNMTMNVTAQDLKEILQRLGIKHTGILGYSMGGRLALHMQLYAAELVDFLILESSTAGIANFGERIERRQKDDSLAGKIESRGLTWFVDYWSNIPLFSAHSRLPSAVKERERQIRLSHNPYGLAQSLRAAGTGRQASLWPVLPYYRAPTLIIAGEDDEKFQAIGRHLHRQLSRSQFIVIDGAGHTTHLEQPERFSTAVTDFLQTLHVR